MRGKPSELIIKHAQKLANIVYNNAQGAACPTHVLEPEPSLQLLINNESLEAKAHVLVNTRDHSEFYVVILGHINPCKFLKLTAEWLKTWLEKSQTCFAIQKPSAMFADVPGDAIDHFPSTIGECRQSCARDGRLGSHEHIGTKVWTRDVPIVAHVPGSKIYPSRSSPCIPYRPPRYTEASVNRYVCNQIPSRRSPTGCDPVSARYADSDGRKRLSNCNCVWSGTSRTTSARWREQANRVVRGRSLRTYGRFISKRLGSALIATDP